MLKTIVKIWNQNKGFIVFIFLMLVFRSAVADWYHVPSGSMQPTILIGDRVWVDKLAYDVKIPFSNIKLARLSEPVRGDVIVFESKVSNNRLIKRVIGMPGDIVELKNNSLYIDNKKVNVAPVKSPSEFDVFLNDRNTANYFFESLQNGNIADSASQFEKTKHDIPNSTGHVIRILPFQKSRLSSFPAVSIPKDHFWVMGDNRDNSADSRVIGFVPREELIGRAEKIIVSFDKNNYYLPRDSRYLTEL